MRKTYIYLILITIFASCGRLDTYIEGKIKTIEATEVTNASALSGGMITFESRDSDARRQILQKGIIWSESINEIQASSMTNSVVKTTNAQHINDTNVFLCRLTGLEPMTTYFVRAFAQFGGGIDNNFVFGDMLPISTFSLVRFRKEVANASMTEMGLDTDDQGSELVNFVFGTSPAISPYFKIPYGLLAPWFYSVNRGNWYYVFPEIFYNFQANRKYTISFTGFRSNDYIFDVIDDGPILLEDLLITQPLQQSKSKPQNRSLRQRSVTNRK